MARGLADRLARLEGSTDWQRSAERAEAARHKALLVLSDATASDLAGQCARTLAKACDARPELRALEGDDPELLRQLDTPTLLALREATAQLEERLEWLRGPRQR